MAADAGQPIYWHGERVGTIIADMYWFHARWRPEPGEALDAFLAKIAGGDDPEILVGDAAPRRFIVTAGTESELELKSV
jgi:hypothetical protein